MLQDGFEVEITVLRRQYGNLDVLIEFKVGKSAIFSEYWYSAWDYCCAEPLIASQKHSCCETEIDLVGFIKGIIVHVA